MRKKNFNDFLKKIFLSKKFLELEKNLNSSSILHTLSPNDLFSFSRSPSDSLTEITKKTNKKQKSFDNKINLNLNMSSNISKVFQRDLDEVFAYHTNICLVLKGGYIGTWFRILQFLIIVYFTFVVIYSVLCFFWSFMSGLFCWRRILWKRNG